MEIVLGILFLTFWPFIAISIASIVFGIKSKSVSLKRVMIFALSFLPLCFLANFLMLNISTNFSNSFCTIDGGPPCHDTPNPMDYFIRTPFLWGFQLLFMYLGVFIKHVKSRKKLI